MDGVEVARRGTPRGGAAPRRQRTTLLRSTEELLASEERLREGLLVETTMVSAIANLRLQGWVLLLSVTAVVVAVIALIVTMHAS